MLLILLVLLVVVLLIIVLVIMMAEQALLFLRPLHLLSFCFNLEKVNLNGMSRIAKVKR